MFYTSLLMILLVTGAVLCSPEHAEPDSLEHHQNLVHDEGPSLDMDKRAPHYDFGLGKRAYSYVSEYKRLPVYNFGLGKRSRPYSFGLGKRSVDEEPMSDEEFLLSDDQDPMANYIDSYDDNNYEVKRARPYSFGLGKRFAEDIDEKRGKLYQFGLGKRLPLYNFGLGKRTKGYNFGLGKRLSKFNFGLGKRERDMSRFSFGLGKRSDYSDAEKPEI